MAATGVERKLAAILSADVQGYSRLMGADEESTLRTLTAYREVFFDEIARNRGRVVNAPGDALLAEFASVVDAVGCAVEIQRELAERNETLPAERRMLFRIGINLGDVMVEGDSIYGDGVNIAARLEALADGGGVCISGTAFDQIEGKLPLHYQSLGEQRVKNIVKPVRVYKVLSAPGAAAHRVVRARNRLLRGWRKVAVAAGLLILLGAGALGGWYWKAFSPSGDGASGGDGISALREKPSIAVLPFNNMSGDPKQEYFSDGFTEDIITDLSKISGLLVIARNSSFQYKGKGVDVRRVGRELGVQYVLEGSVRRADNRIRISAQLIDAATGAHRWAERYDREVQEIFALQDEITAEIVSALELELTKGEIERVRRRTTDDLEAWESYARGLEILNLPGASLQEVARHHFEEALERDPAFTAALLGLGWTYVRDGMKWGRSTAVSPFVRARELALRAMAQDDTLAEPHALLGRIHLGEREHEQAIVRGQRAVALEPNGADWRAYLADTLSYAGRDGEAMEQMQRALLLNPDPPSWYPDVLGRIHYQIGRYDEAIAILKELIERELAARPSAMGLLLTGSVSVNYRLLLIASYSAAGQKKEAEAQAAEFQKGYSNFDPKFFVAKRFLFKDAADERRLLDDLAKAGLK